MGIIDHLLIAPDQPTLIAAIGSIIPVGSNPQPLYSAGGPDGADGTTPPSWRSDVAFPVTISDSATLMSVQSTDANGNPITIQVPTPLTDFHLWVALPAKDPTLSALPYCVLVADRDAANAGSQNFILQTAMTQAQLNSYVVSPTLAGSNYPFGKV